MIKSIMCMYSMMLSVCSCTVCVCAERLDHYWTLKPPQTCSGSNRTHTSTNIQYIYYYDYCNMIFFYNA